MQLTCDRIYFAIIAINGLTLQSHPPRTAHGAFLSQSFFYNLSPFASLPT